MSLLEKIILFFLILIFLISSFFYSKNFYLDHSHLVPKKGGKIIEASLKQPLLLNPLFAFTNSADMDLSRMIFSSLLVYQQNGEIKLDLAQNFEPAEDGNVVTFHLKPNVKWHDGKTFTADDVIFTIDLIKNSKIKTPLYVQFQNISAEKIDDYTIKLNLDKPYLNFLPNLTFGILAKHVWQDVSPANFPIVEYNFNPIGTGPFKFKNLQKDKNGNISQVSLKRNEEYFETVPFLENFNFIFFTDQTALKQAYDKNTISSVLLEDQEILNNFPAKENFSDHSLRLFQSSGIFLNYKDHPILKEKNIRYALEYAINKEKIIQSVLKDTAEKIDLPCFFGIDNPEIEKRDYNPEKASELLQNLGWSKNQEGILTKTEKKKTQIFKLKLFTSDWKDYVEIAKIIQEDLKNIGVDLEVEIMKASQLKQEILLTRKFEMVLFGETSGHNPDPFIFWHSSQTKDPGLNISGFENKEADVFLDEIQKTNNLYEKKEKMKSFLSILHDESPAIFLYQPIYIYRTAKNLQGINLNNVVSPSERFNDVKNWYEKTKRVLGK